MMYSVRTSGNIIYSMVLKTRQFFLSLMELEKSHHNLQLSSGLGGRHSFKVPSPRFLSFQGVLLSFLFQHSFRTA